MFYILKAAIYGWYNDAPGAKFAAADADVPDRPRTRGRDGAYSCVHQAILPEFIRELNFLPNLLKQNPGFAPYIYGDEAGVVIFFKTAYILI